MEGRDKIKDWRELRNVSYKVLENRERHYVTTKCVREVDINLCNKRKNPRIQVGFNFRLL